MCDPNCLPIKMDVLQCGNAYTLTELFTNIFALPQKIGDFETFRCVVAP